MTPSLVRPLATLLLVPLIAHLSGCYVHNPVPREEVEDPAEVRIAGVTTVRGDTVMFDQSKMNPSRGGQPSPRVPTVRADTLFATVEGESYRLPVDQVQRYWIRTVSTGRTIGLVAGVVGGAFLALGAIVAATKESCPFVYSWNGSEWVFDGEPYGGATTRGLERDDWAELEHLVAEDGEYRILVTNEVPETQYTNRLELVVVDHAPGTRVVADGDGGFHVVRSALRPIEATDEAGRDLTGWLAEEDRRVWEPEPDPFASDHRTTITVAFPKPADAERAVLLHRVGTGIWGSYMIKAMLELHGDEVRDWYAGIDSDPGAREALHGWNLREELYALKVEVEGPAGWEEAGVISGGGPFVLESRALPIDPRDAGDDRLRIRVRPPRGFWALDALSVAYGGDDEPLSVWRLPPTRAADRLGRDVRPALTAVDSEYYAMPTNDDRAEVVFQAPPPPAAGVERTVFLHATGWYRIHLDESRAPDRETLRRIATVPGAAARYAAERFHRWQVALR